MTDDHFKKGLITGIIAVFIVGTAPVIVNSRPFEIDFYLFAGQ